MCGAWGAVQAACCVDMAGRAATVSSWLVSSNPAEASGWRMRPCLWLCRLYSLAMRMAKATKHLDVPFNSGLVALLRVKLRWCTGKDGTSEQMLLVVSAPLLVLQM